MKQRIVGHHPVHFLYYGLLKFLIFLCFIISLQQLFANEGISFNTKSTTILYDSDEWVLSKTIDNVSCYYKIVNCKGKSTVVLKFVNNNNYKVQVQWNELFDTQAEKKVQGMIVKKQLKMLANQIVEADCNSPASLKQCVVLPNQVSPAYEAIINGFEFSDILITKQ